MYFDDHEPRHFHATFGEHKVRFRIDPVELIDGGFPQRALRLVRRWALLHRKELQINWERAREGLPLRKIDPLP